MCPQNPKVPLDTFWETDWPETRSRNLKLIIKPENESEPKTETESRSLHVMRIARRGADRSRRAWSVIAILEFSVFTDAARSGGKTLTGPNLVARPAGGRARWEVAEGTPEWAWNNISKTLKLGTPSKIFLHSDFTFHNYHNFQNTVDSFEVLSTSVPF
jgi:hypothetical protein